MARIDFGINIEIDLTPVTPDRSSGRTAASYTAGQIVYPRMEREGWTDDQIESDRYGKGYPFPRPGILP